MGKLQCGVGPQKGIAEKEPLSKYAGGVTGISFQITFGTLPAGGTKENFCFDLTPDGLANLNCRPDWQAIAPVPLDTPLPEPKT